MEARSALTGRIVDSYTNILTVKLFARAREEVRDYVRVADTTPDIPPLAAAQQRLFSFSLSTLNAMLVTGTGGLAMLLWSQGRVEVGTVAMALPLAWQIVSVSGWVAYQVTTIFENVGVVQEGMMTIARPITSIDQPEPRGSRSRAARSRLTTCTVRLRARAACRCREDAWSTS